MVKKALLMLMISLLLMPGWANLRYSYDFLATAIDVNDNVTVVSGGGSYTSRDVDISGGFSVGNITVTFTPATPAAVSIDFEFNVSTDGGTTWTTGIGADAYLRIQINTNVNQIENIVTITGGPFNVHGISHIRLYRVVVGNGAGNCTAINANMSW